MLNRSLTDDVGQGPLGARTKTRSLKVQGDLHWTSGPIKLSLGG